jgi:hypothetical protein
MKKMAQNILLINPWIHDFAAFDLWAKKPPGLLYVGSTPQQFGYDAHLIDCFYNYGYPYKERKFGKNLFTQSR